MESFSSRIRSNAGKTTMFVLLPDFGRDSDSNPAGNGFQHHRTFGDAASRTTWMMALWARRATGHVCRPPNRLHGPCANLAFGKLCWGFRLPWPARAPFFPRWCDAATRVERSRLFELTRRWQESSRATIWSCLRDLPVVLAAILLRELIGFDTRFPQGSGRQSKPNSPSSARSQRMNAIALPRGLLPSSLCRVRLPRRIGSSFLQKFSRRFERASFGPRARSICFTWLARSSPRRYGRQRPLPSRRIPRWTVIVLGPRLRNDGYPALPQIAPARGFSFPTWKTGSGTGRDPRQACSARHRHADSLWPLVHRRRQPSCNRDPARSANSVGQSRLPYAAHYCMRCSRSSAAAPPDPRCCAPSWQLGLPTSRAPASEIRLWTG